jgi:hypothetical protein
MRPFHYFYSARNSGSAAAVVAPNHLQQQFDIA